jgi:hypothetical protein
MLFMLPVHIWTHNRVPHLKITFFDYLTLEDGAESLSQNVGKELTFYAA